MPSIDWNHREFSPQNDTETSAKKQGIRMISADQLNNANMFNIRAKIFKWRSVKYQVDDKVYYVNKKSVQNFLRKNPIFTQSAPAKKWLLDFKKKLPLDTQSLLDFISITYDQEKVTQYIKKHVNNTNKINTIFENMSSEQLQQQDKLGNTPVHTFLLALEKNHHETALLNPISKLKQRQKLWIKNNNEQTLLHLATKYHNMALTRELIFSAEEPQKELEGRDSFENTPKTYAEDNQEIKKILNEFL